MSQFENLAPPNQSIKTTLRVGVNLTIPLYRFAKLIYELKGLNFDERIKHLVAAGINGMHSARGFTQDIVSHIEESFPFLRLSPTNGSDLASKVELGGGYEK